MKKTLLLLSTASLLSTFVSVAQSPTVEPLPAITLTTEGLWNTTTGVANWVTLLNVDYAFELWHEGGLSIDLLAIANLRQEQGKGGVADNLHLFSAIEDSPSTLALMSLGVGQYLAERRLYLFAGIRNLGKDYFTTPWNSIFTSADNGLFPSISTHFVVPDAPKSSMALHCEWHPTARWSLKASLYDGVASQLWGELWRVNLGRDGIFSIAEVGYDGSSSGDYVGNYNLGATFGYAPTAEELSAGGRDKSRRASLWLIAEQPLYRWSDSNRQVQMLLHGAWAPRSDCDLYGALGILCRSLLVGDDYAGVMLSRGLYRGGYETHVEVTYAFSWRYLTLQPALHRIFASHTRQTVAMVKLTLAM